MSAFRQLPLGQRIPGSPHSVSCSLPTMRNVRGYEEKDPAVTKHLTSGYPRFVVHPFARRLAEHFIAKTPALAGFTLWLASSEKMARALATHLGSAAQLFSADGLHGVSHRVAEADTFRRAKLFLQNLGGFLSSREAEDHLVRLGLLAAPHVEEAFSGDAAAEVRRQLRRVLPACADADLILANCGMNAIWAAFRAVSEVQAARGRTVWLQLGWLYLDTICILQEFTGTPASDYVYIRDVFDFPALERIFALHGTRIAGVVAEVPTNPLIQTPDLPALAALCRRHGARLLVDPSISSAWNLDVLPLADVVVTSLTKYTASEGDVLAGLAAVNPAGPDAAELTRRIATGVEPLYPRDLARLAVEIGRTGDVLARIHTGTAQVATFLAAHPAVEHVFWALSPDSRANYVRLARSPDATGGMITFTLRGIGALEKFYDRLRLPKGPSFGMTTTLICPFMYLAHYDLVTTPAGLAELAASQLDPDLLRLCIGTEPPGEIIAALAEALG
ncbi:MAG: PLP-dependent transferase [Verrucomicrobiota bacterium]